MMPNPVLSALSLGTKMLVLGPLTNILVKELSNNMLPHAQEYDIRVSSNLRLFGSF